MNISHTLFVGCGGTGSYLAEPLTRLLAYSFAVEGVTITFCDGDQFEPINAVRQKMDLAKDAGNNKAEVIADQVASMHSRDNVIQSHPDFISPSWLADWLLNEAGDCPMIVACVDNDATRKIICDALEAAKAFLPSFFFITPGNHAGTPADPARVEGQVLWWGWTEGTEFGINPAKLYPNIENPAEPSPVRGTCTANAPSQPQLIAANSMAAAATLSVVSSLLQAKIDPTKHGYFFTPNKAEVI